ncbi:hypothetical protein DVR12_01980 [Chitinophaga silvatica]|uniref:Lipocalin-like domain-containing protein n=1 Tax=Chitinophaga silvatica TaxID=2282649 RepID=A0A3E1YGR3_9BACT|nr:hypothetical protein [Chitinophaga silvatica]RFS26579.1 hypothetical protein DVR12_01980 [Chitinophaga silvatica]
MKTITQVLLLVSIVVVSSCRKRHVYPAPPIGKYELRSEFAENGQYDYPANNGNILSFTGNRIEMYDKTGLIDKGTFEVKYGEDESRGQVSLITISASVQKTAIYQLSSDTLKMITDAGNNFAGGGVKTYVKVN